MSYVSYIKYLIALIAVAAISYAALSVADVFTPEFFAGISAAIIAFVFEKIPGINEDWDKLSGEMKQNVMFVLLLLLVGSAFALSCGGVLEAFQCTVDGGMSAMFTLVIAIGANQGAYLLSKPAPDKKV